VEEKKVSLFNFGEDIKRWFSIFYKDGISAVYQNGFLSKYFNNLAFSVGAGRMIR
jgi:hypothetical protein